MSVLRLLPQLRRYATSASSVSKAISNIRNVGIIAHIDAGKTTSTERLLYYSGSIKKIGDVDDGDTITDYLQAERDRGITIQSAAVTISWKNHKINVIDTPGHADFTFEVVRSLRVLDGAVTILDAVAGVEAQTEKVWKQAKNLQLPTVIYINKMDRMGSGFSRCCKEIISKLKTKIVLTTMPYFVQKSNEPEFSGVIDVVNKNLLKWDLDSNPDGSKFNVIPLNESTVQYGNCFKELCLARESMIETLCDYDETLVDEFLENNEDYMQVSPDSVKTAIRKATISNQISPVLCGASFKNIGIQPLLDAIVDYLPHPNEAAIPEITAKTVKTVKSGKSLVPVDLSIKIDPISGLTVNNNPRLSLGLAFKVTTDARKIPLVFVRIYSGKFSNGSTILNTRTGKKFRVVNLSIINGDHTHQIDHLTCGNIGVATMSLLSNASESVTNDDFDLSSFNSDSSTSNFDDVNEIRTGDTLVAHTIKRDGIKSLSDTEKSISLNPIVPSPSIFITSLEPRTISDKKVLDENLKILLREDPSLKVFVNEEGQTLLSGMGELHLEIVKDRLINDLKTKCDISKVMVTYKETLLSASKVFTKVEGDGEERFEISLSVQPWVESSHQDSDEYISLPTDNNIVYLPLKAASKAVQSHIEYHGNNKTKQSKSNTTVNEAFWPLGVSYNQITGVISSACIGCLQNGGPIANLPLHSVLVTVEKWRMPKASNDLKTLLGLTRTCLNEALNSLDKSKHYTILEPIMKINVFTDNESMGKITHDLTSTRKAEIHSIEDDFTFTDDSKDSQLDVDFLKEAEKQYVPEDSTLSSAHVNSDAGGKVITGTAPLREMIGYLTKLRSLTKGRGTFLMEYQALQGVTKDRLDKIKEEL